MYLQNYCRTCGKSSKKLLPIFEENLEYELNVRIFRYLHIQVEKTDILPLNVCIECRTTLLSFHELYVSYTKANEHFNNQLNSSTNAFEGNKNNIAIDETNFLANQVVCSLDGHKNSVKQNVDHEALLESVTPSTSNEAQQNFSCQHCPQSFQEKGDLIDHLKDVHTDLIFLCYVCKEYLPRSDLIAHMTCHAIFLEQSHQNRQCVKCCKVFKTDKKYQTHLQLCHRKSEKTLSCSECGKKFKYKRLLNNHKQYKHSDVRNYKCDKCEKSFKTDTGLYAHSKVHAENYDFSCEICQKKFKFKVHLSTHLTIHSHEKKFFIRFCSKSFSVKDNLNKHLKIHYKSLEFKFHICPFLTSQRRYLSMHMKHCHLMKITKS